MGKKTRILVIDDNDELRQSLEAHLSNQNFSVASATNGLEGIKLIENEDLGFDLVITDLVMPDISGIGVITILKRKCPSIPVIAITGWGEHPEMLAAEAQADMVMEKPFNLKDLDTNIRSLIGLEKAEIRALEG